MPACLLPACRKRVRARSAPAQRVLTPLAHTRFHPHARTLTNCTRRYLGGAPHSLLVGVGYAAATAWACTGIAAKSGVAPQVAGAARRGALIAAAGGAVGLGLSLLALVGKK